MTKEIDGSDSSATTIAALARAVAAPFTPDAAGLGQAKLLLLDSIGCALAALDDAIARSVVEIANDSGPCPIIGSPKKTGVLDAVLANGTLLRVLDLNDYMIAE